jgi:hypothetical protein
MLLVVASSNVEATRGLLTYLSIYIAMTLALFSILFVSTTNNDMQKYLVN